MPIVPAVTLCNALKDLLVAIKLDPSTGDEALFEKVELYGNKSLGKALTDLVITQGRVCLIVPFGLRRMRLDTSSDRVLSRRFLQVDLLIADRAYYKATQVAVFGGDKNLGVLEMSERVEVALESKDLSDWGAALFDDGAQQTITSTEQKEAPGREVWIQSLLIPAGTNEAVIS